MSNYQSNYQLFYDHFNDNSYTGNNYYSYNNANYQSSEYDLISISDEPIVTVDEIREHLKLDAENSESDGYFQTLIYAASVVGENITRREFAQKVYETYFPCFSNNMLIKKAKVQSIDLIQHLDEDNAWQTLDSSIYYTNRTNNYPNIYLANNKEWPILNTTNMQPVKVRFTVGYSIDDGLPADLKLALMQHIAILYEYRGDWNNMTMQYIGSLLDSIPPASMIIYNTYRTRMLNLI